MQSDEYLHTDPSPGWWQCLSYCSQGQQLSKEWAQSVKKEHHICSSRGSFTSAKVEIVQPGFNAKRLLLVSHCGLNFLQHVPETSPWMTSEQIRKGSLCFPESVTKHLLDRHNSMLSTTISPQVQLESWLSGPKTFWLKICRINFYNALSLKQQRKAQLKILWPQWFYVGHNIRPLT